MHCVISALHHVRAGSIEMCICVPFEGLGGLGWGGVAGTRNGTHLPETVASVPGEYTWVLCCRWFRLIRQRALLSRPIIHHQPWVLCLLRSFHPVPSPPADCVLVPSAAACRRYRLHCVVPTCLPANPAWVPNSLRLSASSLTQPTPISAVPVWSLRCRKV